MAVVSFPRRCAKDLYPEHDLFIQLMKLKNTLRHMMGEDLITHLGRGSIRLTRTGERTARRAGTAGEDWLAPSDEHR